MKAKHALMAVLFLAILMVSCKKHDLSEQRLTQLNTFSETVKRWLESQGASPDYQRFMVDNKLMEVPQQIQWEGSISDEAKTTGITPVSFSSAGTNQSLRKFLVTKNDAMGNIREGGYYVVVTDKASGPIPGGADAGKLLDLLDARQCPEGFNGAVIRYDLNGNIVSSTHYESGKEENKTDRIVVRKGKKQGTVENTAPPPEGCSYVTIDWFWQVYENGVLVYEEYLYSTEVLYCTGGGGGGSGGGNPIEQCNQQFNALVNSATVSNISEGKTLMYETNEEKAYIYRWKCLTSPGGWYVRSYDVGTQERGPSTNWEWHWKSIVHSDIAVIGMPIGGSVERVGSGTGIVTSMGNINAHYSLNFAMKYTPGCSSLGIVLPTYTIDYTASTIFSVYPYVGGPQ